MRVNVGSRSVKATERSAGRVGLREDRIALLRQRATDGKRCDVADMDETWSSDADRASSVGMPRIPGSWSRSRESGTEDSLDDPFRVQRAVEGKPKRCRILAQPVTLDAVVIGHHKAGLRDRRPRLGAIARRVKGTVFPLDHGAAGAAIVRAGAGLDMSWCWRMVGESGGVALLVWWGGDKETARDESRRRQAPGNDEIGATGVSCGRRVSRRAG